MGAGAGILGAGVVGIMDKAQIDPFGDRAALQTRATLDANIITSIKNLQREVRQIQDAQDALTHGSPNERDSAKIADIRVRLDDISKRQAVLERAILNSPEKAIALPLLKRDIESVRDNNNQALLSIKASVDQVYDLSKWLFGTVVLTVISVLVTAYFSRKD